MVGSLADVPGDLSSLGGHEKQLRAVDDVEEEEEEKRGGGVFPDAEAPHKKGKSKSVSM